MKKKTRKTSDIDRLPDDPEALLSAFKRRTSRPPPPPASKSYEVLLEEFLCSVSRSVSVKEDKDG